MRRHPLPLLAALALFSTAAQADIQLANVFSDNMVLQRDKAVPVWGWDTPGTEVTVSFAGQTAKARADANGKWLAKLPPLPCSTEGRELLAEGDGKAAAKNVVVGDVWLCSGQSNMAFGVGGCLNAQQEKAEAGKYPLIRQFTVAVSYGDQPSRDVVGCGKSWAVCGPSTISDFSATGFFFARRVFQETGVPIGLLVAAAWGSPIEPLIAPEAFAAIPELQDVADSVAKLDAATDSGNRAYQEAIAKLKAWLPEAEQAVAAKTCPPPMPQLPSLGDWEGLPCKVFNSMISPLAPFALKGVLWYQGESDTRKSKADRYYHRLHALVAGWRGRWGGEELPFYYVQLPGFGKDDPEPEETGKAEASWCWAREAQARCQDIPNSGMAVAIDIIGMEAEKEIHPPNKQDVGLRLALLALAKTYGKTGLPCSGPMYKTMTVEGTKIRVSFDHAGSGLMVGDKVKTAPAKETPGGKLKRFAIAGQDRKWHWADAAIDGDTVLVSSPEVKTPVAVRYAFSTSPAGRNLYNKEGFPAAPFRTDNW